MLSVWPLDSLTKVFPEDRPPEAAGQEPMRILAARGAVESAQCVLWLEQDAREVRVEIRPPAGPGGTVLEDVSWRRVEFVPVRRPAFCLDPSQRLRNGPAFIPDPLLDEEALEAAYSTSGWAGPNRGLWPGGTALPLWLTLRVPREAAPGRYRGAIVVTCEHGAARLPMVVQVSPAVLPERRTLKLTQWFSAGNIAEVGEVEPWSEGHWRLLALWGRNLAAHRANVILSPLTELLDLSRDAAGNLQVDFARFDRWVRTFQRAGAIGYIEGGHLAGRLGDWEGGFGLNGFVVRRADGTEENLGGTPVEAPHAQEFLRDLMRAIEAHLRERRWLRRYYQHLADEPVAANAASYRALATAVREAAPTLPRLDATMADESLAGTVTVWCPQSQEAEKELRFFQARQALGEEVWHYTCLAPNGAYPNRFLNQPLIATRLLHWFNYKAGLTGYLHWGFNHWGGWRTPRTPHCDTESTTVLGRQQLPAGDTHLVYPGPGGRPLDSLRHEMVLEGVQDYELLRILGAARPEQAQRLAERLLPSLTEYEKDPAKFRAVRAELLRQVAKVQ